MTNREQGVSRCASGIHPPTTPHRGHKGHKRVTSTNPSSAGTSTILPDRQIGQDGVGMGWLIAFAIGDTSRLFMPPHSLAHTHARTRASDKKSVHISRANKSLRRKSEREREKRRPTKTSLDKIRKFRDPAGLLGSLVFDRFAPPNSERIFSHSTSTSRRPDARVGDSSARSPHVRESEKSNLLDFRGHTKSSLSEE